MSNFHLAGDLSSFPLPDILLLVSNNRKSGSLRCSRAATVKTLEWEDGSIVFARSTVPEDRLGAFLQARGVVTAEKLQKAGPMVGTQDRLGKTLIRLGVLTPAVLWEAVQGQVAEIVYSLFNWKDGTFEFREGAPSAEKIVMNTSVMNLIMEGTRRFDEWSLVRQKTQNDRVVLSRVKSPDEAGQMVELSDVERVALDLVDGRRTVREVVDAAGRAEFETWQALYSLLSAGVIRVAVLAFDLPGPQLSPAPAAADDDHLNRTLDLYSGLVSKVLDRVEQTAGPEEVARLRRRLRQAKFERADLLRESAIAQDGGIDRRVLLANVAEDPPGERARNLQTALDSLITLLANELKGKIDLDDIMADLRTGTATPTS